MKRNTDRFEFFQGGTAVLLVLFLVSGGGHLRSQDNNQVPLPNSPPPNGAQPERPLQAQPVVQPSPGVAPPKEVGGGATISAERAQSKVIKNERPERVKVYPDDPDSAWWEINPHYAFARAQREQKPLMLLFTGIWNQQAMGLSQEVFSTKSFNEYVKESLVICYLDYPKNITEAPDALRMIKKKFKVKGYPNVLLFNPQGEVFRGLRGYRTGKPVTYFNKLKVACKPVLASIEAQREALEKRGFRDWSNYLGKVIFAKFISRDDQYVALMDVSGQKWYVPMNDLKPEDQKLAESFPKGKKIELPENLAKK